jgi:signal transduction histidine kinase
MNRTGSVDPQAARLTGDLENRAALSARILAIDDEPLNTRVLLRLLEHAGYSDVHCLTDPRDVLPTFLEMRPDLVLLDLHMPYFDGFAVMERLQPWLSPDEYLPIVVLTADITTEAKRRALAAGAADFLTKPFDSVEVLLRIQNLLEIRSLHQQLRQRTDALEERLGGILDSLDQVVWSATMDGRPTFVSPAVEPLFGTSATRLLDDPQLGRALLLAGGVGQPWNGLTGSPGSPGSDSDELEYKITRPDGVERWLRTRARLVRDADGTPIRIDGISADITEHRRLVEEVARLAAEREMNRIKREFVSIASHELRTPLSALVGFSELLLQPDVAEDERQLWTQTMYGESLRLTQIVDDLLDLSRIEAGRITIDPVPVDPRDVVERALAPFEAGPDGPRLSRDYAESLPLIPADSAKLGQVLTNLLSNAIKYSPAGGPIIVRIAQVGEVVRFSVADKGLGIPAEGLRRLFERFYRVQESDRGGIRGTGLGLYISRQLVELHDGRIWAESDGLGKGSTFILELPAIMSPVGAESDRV